MERRTFLAATLAALAAPYLPEASAGVKVPDLAVWNTATLTSSLEKMFACQVGPAAPMFDMVMGVPMAIRKIQKPHPIYPNLTIEDSTEPTDPSQRHAYVTYVCAVKGGSEQDAEARLAKHFYDQFSQLPAGQLVWRLKPHFESGEVVEFGDTFLTAEMVVLDAEIIEDYPDIAKDIPQGVELDFATNSYRYVKEKYMLHKMRMRLVMPHLEEALPDLVKEEGGMINHVLA